MDEPERMPSDPRVVHAWKGLFRLTRMRTRRAVRRFQPWPGLENLHYNAAFRRKLLLSDGTRVVVRLLRRGDRPYLEEGLHLLSPQSRYLRFHSAKNRFSRDELRYLTEIDQRTHFALVVYGREGVRRRGIAVARFVVFPGDEHRAEAALVVSDTYQGKGLGKQLMDCLLGAAAERGITTLVCEVLSENRAARALLETRFHGEVIENDGAALVLALSVLSVEPRPGA